MRIAYFDCFAGISGDMVLGALIDAGLDPALLQSELDKLQIPGLRLEIEKTSRHAIAATRVHVHTGEGPVAPEDEHHIEPAAHEHEHGHQHKYQRPHTHEHQPPHEHHHLGDVLARIRHSHLDPEIAETAARVFERLGRAEAEVHGVPSEEVHLHEVGALDAVADIVGAVAGLRLLGVDQVHASPLRFGTGFVRCAHGRYPVPVPGVLALCRDVPAEQTDIRSELVTPTGAALITTLARSFGPAPPFRQQQVGYGAGRRDLKEIPNLLRVRIGESQEGLSRDRLVQVEVNIDDMNPEVYGYLFERLLEEGARDVFVTPVHMKKGRPAHVLSVLVDEDGLDAIAALVFAETTTIGLRYHPVERRLLERSQATVSTPYGEVRLKVCHFDGKRRAAPEYEDCAALARRYKVPILAVYEAARKALNEE